MDKKKAQEDVLTLAHYLCGQALAHYLSDSDPTVNKMLTSLQHDLRSSGQRDIQRLACYDALLPDLFRVIDAAYDSGWGLKLGVDFLKDLESKLKELRDG